MTNIVQTTTTTINNYLLQAENWYNNPWLVGFVTNILSSAAVAWVTKKIVWRKASRKMNTTPEDILTYIDTLRDKSESMKEADKKTLLACYHCYKEQAERIARGEKSEGVQDMKTLLPHERRLIVTLYNAIRSRSFMGRKFVLRPLDEAKSQSWGNIDYRDFVSDVVSEEFGVGSTPAN